MKRLSSKLKALVALMIATLVSSGVFAQTTDVISYNSSTPGPAGVSVNPDVLVTPMVTVIVTCVAAAAAIWLIWAAIGWLKKLFKG